MRTFKDKEGTEWLVEFNLYNVMQIEGYDFTNILGSPKIKILPPQPDFFDKIITNTPAILAMVWCCLREQASERGIANEIDFARRINGNTIQEARIAFWGELSDFFPEMRTTLQTLTGKLSRAQVLANERMTKEVEQKITDSAIQEVLDKLLEKKT